MQKISSVLLVDDDPTTNYLNRKLLERLAVASTIEVAQNGQQALRLISQRGEQVPPAVPALLLLDVKMPVMDGFEFLNAYSRLPTAWQRQMVVVMLTTSLHPHDLERLAGLPISGFLSKPLTADKVDKVLREHFARELPSSQD